ncbi:MAG: hypothetical protein NZ959_03040 [Armatimonadetes bacterium]|nr:hypothetical protein [Armatimonadota bacterium]MDW8121573.1 hypothetical protein [Armatimonadota bacterium]
MKCPWEMTINRLMDDELPDQLREGAEVHLKECPLCRETLADFMILREWIKKTPVPEPRLSGEGAFLKLSSSARLPIGFLQKLRAELEEWIARPVVAFRMAVTVALMVALLLASQPDLPANLTQALHDKVRTFSERSEALFQSLHLFSGQR